MSILTPPRLDDRSWEDLRRELVRRIPMHAPDWTNHNATDPGIALLELFAWLTEGTLSRLNQVPENAHREFLRLLQVDLRSASSATAQVAFSLAKGSADPVVLDYGPTSVRAVVAAGKVEFQVQDEVDVLPLQALGVLKMPGPELDEEDDDLREAIDAVKQALSDHLDLDDTDEAGEGGHGPTLSLVTYTATQLMPPEGDELPDPHNVAAAIDDTLWIALVLPEAVARKYTLDDVRSRLAGRILSLGVRVDDELCGSEDGLACPGSGGRGARHDVIWQMATGSFNGEERRVDRLRFLRLGSITDTTEGLARSGVVRLQLPLAASDLGVWTEDDFDDPELFGTGDLPPALDDDQLTARIVTWIRAFRRTAPQPVVRWLGANVVAAVQAVTASPELLGYGTGETKQSYALAKTPVVPASVYVEVKEASGWVPWVRVPDLSVARASDPHYVLDATAGTVTFGDGVNGRMPRPGEAIRVRSYRYGGGVQGSVSAATITRIRKGPDGVRDLSVTNPLPAEGGRDGETLQEARARLPQVLRHRDRAVAAQDFVDLALETSSTHVGRAHVLPLHKPQERVDGVPGVVSLIVLPAYDAVHPDEPMPDREMLRRVCEHLDPRRLVTTELYIIPPEYVPVWISVAVDVQEGYGIGTVRRWVELAIRQHLAPLPPYGPSGLGWSFGREVRVADIESAALRVEGVELVREVLLAQRALDGTASQTDTVTLEAWQLPVVRSVQVASGESAEAIALDGDELSPGESDDSLAVAVPVLEETC